MPLRNISVGDIVLSMDENLPRNVWELGKVIEVYFGKDKLTRIAKIKTKTTTLVRPVTKRSCVY
ncbi:hypothetical protein HOLleu_01016 [Holothuria leucospilota]|uniref:DUF5641 domain-containing protein n=1 Tax=Holothuria leucospilota TaxID=206669 RepID=A0A9Q1HJ06_HOLLE|nr:hypothetical protein HOLleu_01016 [Holothuria leucospilota]